MAVAVPKTTTRPITTELINKFINYKETEAAENNPLQTTPKLRAALHSIALITAVKVIKHECNTPNVQLTQEGVMERANELYFSALKELVKKNITLRSDASQPNHNDIVVQKVIKELETPAPANGAHQSEHAHEHEHGGGIVIDLDEAVHGAYAATKYLMSVFQGNPTAIWAEFKHEALEMKSDAFNHTGQELLPDGIGEFAAAVGISAIMVPLAFLAVKAGIEEFSHAKHALKILKKQNLSLEETKKIQTAAARIVNSQSLNHSIQLTDSQLKLNQLAQKLTKDDKMIGIGSLCSGLSIGIKALGDIALKVSVGAQGALTGKGFFNLAQTAQVGTAAGTGATIVGVASTFVLGPLAGFFATTLGAYFVHKTGTKRAQLKREYTKGVFENEELNLKKVQPRATSEAKPLDKYKSFLKRQGEKRISFFKNFGRWNKAFLLGSGLYAASATTKAILTGIAVAGAAALVSNPIGIATLAAVGTVGAVIMGVGSYRFITGHGKQGKYNGVTSADHVLVDRDFIVQQQVINQDEGINLAAASLERLDVRKQAIRDFLEEAAAKSASKEKTKLSPHQKTTTEQGKSKHDLTIWKRLRGQALSEKDVMAYLSTPEGLKALKTLVETDLKAEKTYLTKKTEARKKVTIENDSFDPEKWKLTTKEGLPKNILEGQTPAKVSQEAFLGYINLLSEHDLELLKDEDRLNQISLILQPSEPVVESTTQRTITDDTDDSESTQASQIKNLLEHIGITIDTKGKTGEKEKKEILHQAAHHLLNDLDTDLRKARGVLFETQLQASQLVKNAPPAVLRKTASLATTAPAQKNKAPALRRTLSF